MDAVKAKMRVVLAQLVHSVACLAHNESNKSLCLLRNHDWLLWIRVALDRGSVDLWYSQVELRIPRGLSEWLTRRKRDKILYKIAKRDAELYEAIRDIKGRAKLLWLIRQRTRMCWSGVGKLPTEICMCVLAIVNRLTLVDHSMWRPYITRV